MVGEDATMSNPSSADTLDARIATALKTARQPRPKLVRPIVVIGAGRIVRVAHLPAYEKAGFPVIALMDRDKDKTPALAADRGISHSIGSLAEAVSFAPRDAVFDIAVLLLSSSTSFRIYLMAQPHSSKSPWEKLSRRHAEFATS